MIREGYEEILKTGLWFQYRNVTIKAYSHGSDIDVRLFIDCDKSPIQPYSRRGIVTRWTKLTYNDNHIEVQDFEGGTHGETISKGIGRQGFNATVELLKKTFDGDTRVIGYLSNAGGKPMDHERRVKFWESCGFTIKDPTNYRSPMKSTVSDLIAKNTYKGKTKDPFGVPYLTPIEAFIPMNIEHDRKKDKEELATFPRKELSVLLDSLPGPEDIETEKRKFSTKLSRIRASLVIISALTTTALASYLDWTGHLIVYSMLGGFIGLGIHFKYDFIRYKNIATEQRSAGLLKLRKIISEWVAINPTGLSYLSELSEFHNLERTKQPVLKDCSCLTLEGIHNIVVIHGKIFPNIT